MDYTDTESEGLFSLEKRRLREDIAEVRCNRKSVAIVCFLAAATMFSVTANELHTSLTVEKNQGHRNRITQRIIDERVNSQTRGEKDKVAADLLKAFRDRGFSEEILVAKIPEKEITVSARAIDEEIQGNLSQLSESSMTLAKIFSVFGLILAGAGIVDYRTSGRKIAVLEQRLANLDGPG